MPTWPPSPAWVMTALPWVSFSYNRIYFDLFGAYERRLNKALRGRGLPNENGPVAEDNDGDMPQADVGAENGAAPEPEDEGYFAQALRLGNAVLNMMGDENNDEGIVAEIELQIGPEDDEQQVVQELQNEIDELNEIAAGNRVAPEVAVVEDEQTEDPQQPEQAEGDDDAAEPPPAIRIEPRAQAPAAQNVNNDNNQLAPEEPIREARGTSTTLTDLVNGVVSALTFPLVCWASGEVLRHTLPITWVTRPSAREATGLLQEQWGRSLVGGAVFIVARDMVNLYSKHRQVEVRKHRRVRNVPRRKVKGPSRQNSEAPATPAT